jgi:uncharacterized repeat protein (TIGR03843 family)
VPAQQRPPRPLTILGEGDIELRGRLPWSSNATFLVTLCLDGTQMDAVYKPRRGERPLWDFPDGLCHRELAAYRVSETLGWGLVPETLVRDDGPFGPGSLQRFVPSDFSQHYFTLVEREEHHDALRQIAVFDLVVNNADRKSGHCLLGEDGRIRAIDHGVCFHSEPKLRTVIWDFAGEPIPESLLADLERVTAQPVDLEGILTPREIQALSRRAGALVRLRRFPEPGPGRPYPWPLV